MSQLHHYYDEIQCSHYCQYDDVHLPSCALACEFSDARPLSKYVRKTGDIKQMNTVSNSMLLWLLPVCNFISFFLVTTESIYWYYFISVYLSSCMMTTMVTSLCSQCTAIPVCLSVSFHLTCLQYWGPCINCCVGASKWSISPVWCKLLYKWNRD